MILSCHMRFGQVFSCREEKRNLARQQSFIYFQKSSKETTAPDLITSIFFRTDEIWANWKESVWLIGQWKLRERKEMRTLVESSKGDFCRNFEEAFNTYQ